MTSAQSSSAKSDPFNLSRFLEAQEDTYRDAVEELRLGRKRSHWMWFVFPQFDGLGTSLTARTFAIKSTSEARGYLKHPVLGQRLVECTNIVNALSGRTVAEIFGAPDDLKFCSSMTLFGMVAGPGSAFEAALARYFSGQRDAATVRLIQGAGFSTG